MQKLLVIVLLVLSNQALSQNFTIQIKDHPFYNIVEWKGKGGLLMSRSPKEFMNQINLSMIGDIEEAHWDQKFNPKTRDPFYLFQEGTRHVYFIDNLDPKDNGRLTFNQINSAGNVKSKILDIGIKVKRIPGGYDYNSFKLVDAAVTERTLVYQYRLHNKKEKEYNDFAVFMTHHNLQPIVFKIGNVDVKDVQEEKRGQWQYSGYQGDVVYFSWGDLKTDVPGWTVKGYNSKGETAEDHWLTEPKNIISFRNIGYSNTGKSYIQDIKRHTIERGIVSYINEKFYVTVIEQVDGKNSLVLYQQDPADGDLWIELNRRSMPSLVNKKDEIQLGTFAINEGVTYRYKVNDEDKVGILLFDQGVEGEEMDYYEGIEYNPSALILENEKNVFVTKSNDKILKCKLDQFQRGGGIGFNHH